MFRKLHALRIQSISLRLNVSILMKQQSIRTSLERILGDLDETVHKIATHSAKQDSSDNSPNTSPLINQSMYGKSNLIIHYFNSLLRSSNL